MPDLARQKRIAAIRAEHAVLHASCIWRRDPRAKYGPICHDPCHRAISEAA